MEFDIGPVIWNVQSRRHEDAAVRRKSLPCLFRLVLGVFPKSQSQCMSSAADCPAAIPVTWDVPWRGDCMVLSCKPPGEVGISPIIYTLGVIGSSGSCFSHRVELVRLLYVLSMDRSSAVLFVLN